jgi:hypothetical protein
MRCPRPGLVSAVQVAFVQLAFASFGFGRFCTSPSLPADGSRWVLYFAACVAVVVVIVLFATCVCTECCAAILCVSSIVGFVRCVGVSYVHVYVCC